MPCPYTGDGFHDPRLHRLHSGTMDVGICDSMDLAVPLSMNSFERDLHG